MNKLLKVSMLSVFALVLLFSASNVFAARWTQQDTTYSNDTSSNARCTLVSFNARPATITAGQPVTLSWTTSGCTSANILPIGSVSLSGSKIVYPTSTTHYALTAYGPGLNDDELQVPLQKTVTVSTTDVDCNNIPFSASPSTIRQGQSSVLSWDATGCTNVTISSGGYPISSNASSKGRLSVSPTKTTIYAITAFPRGSFDELPVPSYVTVTVGGGSASYFKASPSSITLGEYSTLSWDATPNGVTSCRFAGNELVPISGSRTVSPLWTTDYAIYCDNPSTGAGYSGSATVTIRKQIPAGVSDISGFKSQSQYQTNTTTEQYRSWKNYSIPSVFRNFSSWRNSYSR
jgi:hypothetical protein